MHNITYKVISLIIDIINKWIELIELFYTITGVVFGAAVLLAFLTREKKVSLIFSNIAILILIFQIGFYFAIPYLYYHYAGVAYQLPSIYFWSFWIEAAAGIALIWLTIRFLSPSLEKIKYKLIKTSTTERNRKTDIREISKYLPDSQKPYDPTQFFNNEKGLFIGLDEQRMPVYITWQDWQKRHLELVGTTGSGKGVAAGVILTQAVSIGECVIVLDPKDDEFLSHVMHKAAQDAGVPYVYIDLKAEVPQWNPLQHKNANEIEELLCAGFSLGEKGTDADFYRLNDRCAARIFANLAYVNQTTLIDTLQLLIEQHPDIAEAGKKFVSDLQEISLIATVNTSHGVDLAKLMQQGAVVYVRGSMRNPRILKLQRILFLSMIQFIESRDRESARRVCLFLDEFKYLISRPALEALGAIRDKRAHVLIAHQSLGDLRDCPADLDPESVVSSVNENCAIKIAYKVKDPDTAQWLARMSGSILVDDEIRQVKTNSGLTEIRDGERTLKQAERFLIDTNMLQSLPDRCAVLYGVGLAEFCFTSPIKVIKSEEATTPFKTVNTNKIITKPMQTIAQGLLDVD